MAKGRKRGAARSVKTDSACERLLQASGLAYSRGDILTAMDKYREAFQCSRSGWNLRFNCVRGYGSILREEQRDNRYCTPEYLQPLKDVSRDEGYCLASRVEAHFTYGLMLWQSSDREGAAKEYRSAIALAVNATEEDLKGTVKLANAATMSWGNEPQRIHVFGTAQEAERNLAVLERRPTRTIAPSTAPTQSVGARIPDKSLLMTRIAVPADGQPLLTQQELEALQKVDGSCCSSCGKERQPGAALKVCSRCRRAFYCGASCQKAAWATHKGACRAAGKFKAGDLVVVQGLVKAPEMNGLVTILLQPSEKEGRWDVSIAAGESSNSVGAVFVVGKLPLWALPS